MNEIKQSGDGFVADGGWVKRKFYGRPRTRLFTLLSLFWIAVSVPAGFIVFSHTECWVRATSISEKLRAVAFEQWIGLFLIVLHLLFVTLAIRFHFTEEPREEVFLEDNPDQDPHKLY
jgi:hypothetical protein